MPTAKSISPPKADVGASCRPTDKGFEKVSQGRLAVDAEIQGSPIVSHGRIYVPTTAALLLLG